ncbi:MAG TPA: alpha/beta fold hydrolase [Rhodothermales bacterium]|nr:alpha/beta fold hydrolase [Rhodothermales bacterium]
MAFRRYFLLLPLCFALLLAGCDSASMEEEVEPRVGRGATISTTLLSEQSADELNATFNAIGFPVTATNDVAVYKIVYETIDPQGTVTQASGALMVPQNGSGRYPMVTYQHGTMTARSEAPSAGGFEQIVGLLFAGTGYVAVMPDLLGLGDSPGLHPFVHAASSASAAIDMLRASQDFTQINGPDLNGQLFITGYSQGGYTAMAAHREIQATPGDEFTVTASAPLAGPHDLSGAMANTFTQGQPHPSPFYLPYTLFAYNDVYQIYDSPSDFLAEPYNETLPPLFDMMHTGGEINAALPDVPDEIIRTDVLVAFETDPDHPLRQRLRENDLYNWTPEAPMRLYHCAGDRHVPQANSIKAFESFHDRGARQVEFFDPMPSGDHGDCAGPSLVFTKFWFDTLVE